MPMEKFRMKSPTIALFKEDGREVAHMVPQGATVLVAADKVQKDKFVEVVWDDMKARMFKQDLRSRGVKVE